MKRAYSVANVINASFKRLEFSGKWNEAIGDPELTGSWFIQGRVKNGKTSLAMQLGKYLAGFSKVAYNSVEEGLSATMQDAFIRAGLQDVSGKFVLLDKEDPEELKKRLMMRKSPNIIFIDTVQFWDLKFSEYKALKKMFPHKLFVFLSHMRGNLPAGSVAEKIWRDANVSFTVEGFVAFPVGRYGGGRPVVINKERAANYWGLEKVESF